MRVPDDWYDFEPPAQLRGKDELCLEARVWYCGDDYCDCTQPVIAWRYREPGNMAYRTVAIWEGTFVSREFGDPDDPDPDEELEDGLRQLGVRIGG